MNAVDTNILIYARDPRDPIKQATAEDLISSMVDGVLLWQVACEYASQTILPSWNVLDDALRLLRKYRLSFWRLT